MTEEAKEISPREKLQVEYNRECALNGHLKSQIFDMQEKLEQSDERLKKMIKKASNLPQEKKEEGEKKDEHLA